MDEYTYSKKTLDAFTRDTVCQGDRLAYKYYQRNQMQYFRRRLRDDDDVKKAVQTFITDATRYIITDIIAVLTKKMRSYGDVIMSGGEAINSYLDRENRIITTDIDTKFVPNPKVGTRLLKPDDAEMFGYIQLAKLRMWNTLGQIVTRYNARVIKKLKKLASSKFGKMLGVSFPNHLCRRYTLIKKNKELGVLTDIELFAIDLKVRYYVPSEKKISSVNIGGLLDIAFMRPGEFGYEASNTYRKGIPVTNPVTGASEWNMKVLVATPKFLIHDVYSLQKYNLRPDKKEKDRKRLFAFAKYVMGSKTANRGDSIEALFQKSIRLTRETERVLSSRPGLTQKAIASDMRVDPYRYEKVTTVPLKSSVYKQFFYGIKTSNNVNVPGYAKTMGSYRFDANKGTWVKNNSPTYIHNEATHRPTNIKNFPVVPVEDTLYGYSPARDAWMTKELVRKSAMIPLVGLKIKTA